MAAYRRLAAAAVSAAAPAPTASLAALRPGIAIVVCALTITFSLTFALLLYAKHCRRSSGGGGGGSSSSNSAGAAPARHSGTARAVVESLPAFRFGALQGSHKDGLECAVCLARFETAEVLRLLPKCRHAFHLECVDVWLDAHSTCPLCRSRVDPEDVLLIPEPNPPRSRKIDPGDPPPPGRRISGRHSSAGEISAAHRADTMWRRSADSATRAAAATAASVGCFERARKDGLLLAEREGAVAAVEQRFGHRIVVTASCGSGGVQERWSDLRPADLLVLRREMIIGDGGRSASEITRYPRRCGGAGRRDADEVERRWRLGWGRSGDSGNGPSG